MTSKKKTTYSLGIVILALLIGLLIGVMTAPKISKSYWMSPEGDNLSARINTMMRLIDHYYVDTVNYDSLSDKMLNAMLSTLDPHSHYLSSTAYDKAEEEMQGQYEGIGLLLNFTDNAVYANGTSPNSPASKAGFLPGDRIIKIDNTQIDGTDLLKDPHKVVGMIRGPRFSTVTIGIKRGGSDQIKYIRVQRNILTHGTIPAAFMLTKNTGYIYISTFGEHTGTEFHSALLELNSQGMENLILDLRGNGGGSLQSAIDVADELLPPGNLIVYTKGSHWHRENAYARYGGLFEKGRLSILINEETASASEIVAGAVQDNDRGTIIGHRSFGKGLVQKRFGLTDNSAIMLTIGRYYTPSGRCIQRPYDKGTDEYYSEFLQRVMLDYASADSILNASYDTTQTFLTKNGRKVYGGGGIQPDVNLPYFIDDDLIYYNSIVNSTVISGYIGAYLHNHCAEMLKRYPTIDTFKKNFQVNDTMLNAILADADKKGIQRQENSLRKYGQRLRNQIKAAFAFSLYGENYSNQIAICYDIEVQKALQITTKK